MNAEFKMHDSWYEPPTSYNWYCPECFWCDEAFFPKGKAYDFMPERCPDCGHEDLALNRE